MDEWTNLKYSVYDEIKQNEATVTSLEGETSKCLVFFFINNNHTNTQRVWKDFINPHEMAPPPQVSPEQQRVSIVTARAGVVMLHVMVLKLS